MSFSVREVIRIIPDEGYAPKAELSAEIVNVDKDERGWPTYRVRESSSGSFYWLTSRAADGAGMVFHVFEGPGLPDIRSGHGFVTVKKKEPNQSSQPTRGKAPRG